MRLLMRSRERCACWHTASSKSGGRAPSPSRDLKDASKSRRRRAALVTTPGKGEANLSRASRVSTFFGSSGRLRWLDARETVGGRWLTVDEEFSEAASWTAGRK